jgi:hypothetical protein
MTMAMRASTEAIIPKMMVPVESEVDSVDVEAMAEFVARKS